MSEITITKANFEEEVLHADKPVLVDFWASWCGPCKMLAPVLHEFADEHAEVKVGKVNVDEEMDLAMRFGVSRRSSSSKTAKPSKPPSALCRRHSWRASFSEICQTARGRYRGRFSYMRKRYKCFAAGRPFSLSRPRGDHRS